jgi:hypothetical protein
MHVEMGRFLQIAIGPASEPEYQLLLAHDLDYLRNPEYERLRTQAFDQMVELLENEMSSSEIFAALFELELNGKIRQLPEEFCEEPFVVSYQLSVFR